ncbi:MAG: hypothetical protein ACR2NZ_12610 [Rubripirellula sp.]
MGATSMRADAPQWLLASDRSPAATAKDISRRSDAMGTYLTDTEIVPKLDLTKLDQASLTSFTEP